MQLFFFKQNHSKPHMPPNAGPNWTQTVPWICNLEGWFEVEPGTQVIFQVWSWKFHVSLAGDEVNNKKTCQRKRSKPGRFAWFYMDILYSLQRNYSGSGSVVGENLKPQHLQEKLWLIFSLCVGFQVHRTSFQSKPQQAEKLALKRENTSDMKGQHTQQQTKRRKEQRAEQDWRWWTCWSVDPIVSCGCFQVVVFHL